MKYTLIGLLITLSGCATYTVDESRCFDRKYYCQEAGKVVTIRHCEARPRLKTRLRLRVGI